MHDHSLEQRLRSALQAEGDGLAFTITAAELERRQALRRRGGPGPLVSLGLAAAVGLGLLGLVGVAGGWFEQHTAITPSASPSPAGPAASTSPSDRVARDTLPTLDELIGTRDPATIFRAQAVGPEGGPEGGTLPVPSTSADPGTVRFAAPQAAGTYAVDVACIGSVDFQILVVKANRDVPGSSVPVRCDGGVSSLAVDLAVGDAIGIKTSGSPSWRIVVVAPARVAPIATTIDLTFGPPAGDVSLSEGNGETVEPTFVGSPAPLDTIVPVELGPVPPRRSYRVLTSCAGPGPVRYVLGSRSGDGSLAIDAYVTTAVACDGTVQVDDLGLTERNGAQVFVIADPRVVWRVMVASDLPPVALAANDATWGMREAIGPTVELGDTSYSLSSGLEGKERDIRVVVTCLGGTGVDVTVHDVDTSQPAVGSFHVDCRGPDATTIAKVFTLRHPEYIVEFQPRGEMWLAGTVQGRLPASPPA
jgi:hypothetical protein